MKHINITVTGRVQGVFFRDHCRKCARIYGIKGYAKNLANGNVYVEAEGQKLNLGEFVKAVRAGNGYSRVEQMNVVDGAIENFSAFNIRY